MKYCNSPSLQSGGLVMVIAPFSQYCCFFKKSAFASGFVWNRLWINCWFKQREFKEQSTSFGLSGPLQKYIQMKPAMWEKQTDISEQESFILSFWNIQSPEEARCCGSVPLLLRCPHGNNNLALDVRLLGACWGIICTSSWTLSITLHWMTGGRHGSAKCRDLGAAADGNVLKCGYLEIKEYLCCSQVCQSHLKVWWRPRHNL